MNKVLIYIENDCKNNIRNEYVFMMRHYINFVYSYKYNCEVSNLSESLLRSDYNTRLISVLDQPKKSEQITSASNVVDVKDARYINRISTDKFTISSGSLSDMFIKFVNKVGPEIVYNMDFFYHGVSVVTKDQMNDYYTYLTNGYWLNTEYTLKEIVEIVTDISNRLELHAKIELI